MGVKVEPGQMYLFDKLGKPVLTRGQSRASLREEIRQHAPNNWYQRRKTKAKKRKKEQVVSKSVLELANQLKIERDKAEVRKKIELLSQSAINHRNKNMANVRVRVSF